MIIIYGPLTKASESGFGLSFYPFPVLEFMLCCLSKIQWKGAYLESEIRLGKLKPFVGQDPIIPQTPSHLMRQAGFIPQAPAKVNERISKNKSITALRI